MDATLERLVRQRAAGRCEYCRLPQAGTRVPLEIDHVIARKHRGRTVSGNLALSCYYWNEQTLCLHLLEGLILVRDRYVQVPGSRLFRTRPFLRRSEFAGVSIYTASTFHEQFPKPPHFVLVRPQDPVALHGSLSTMDPSTVGP